MKKFLSVLLAVLVLTSLLAGCAKTAAGSGSAASAASQTTASAPAAASSSAASSSAASSSAAASTSAAASATTSTGKLPKIACLLNGNLGDKSFFDSANAGCKLIQDQLGCETNVIEMGFDNTVWETTLYEVSEQDYDIIIVGTYQMQELLQKVAPQYPDKKYIIFDSSVDYTKGDCNNVYSITFKQNEASYLAGALAAMLADDSSLPYSNGKNIISVVAAMDIPVLNDFIVGYIQGATDTVPDTKVAISVIGDFNDTAKAKDLATAQFNLGSSVAFNVAAQAGLGMIEGAAAAGRYAIGVDSDQAAALAVDGKDNQAAVIPTSVLKNIDQALLLSIKRAIAGELPYGTSESLGMGENAVGLAQNDYYTKLTTQEMRDKIDDLQSKIQSGAITVNSAFSMSDDEISALKTKVAP